MPRFLLIDVSLSLCESHIANNHRARIILVLETLADDNIVIVDALHVDHESLEDAVRQVTRGLILSVFEQLFDISCPRIVRQVYLKDYFCGSRHRRESTGLFFESFGEAWEHNNLSFHVSFIVDLLLDPLEFSGGHIDRHKNLSAEKELKFIAALGGVSDDLASAAGNSASEFHGHELFGTFLRKQMSMLQKVEDNRSEEDLSQKESGKLFEAGERVVDGRSSALHLLAIVDLLLEASKLSLRLFESVPIC